MRPTRTEAASAIALAAGLAATGFAYGRWELVGPLVLAALALPWARRRFELRVPGIAYPLLVLPFAALYRSWPIEDLDLQQPNLRYHAALYAVTAAMLRFLGPADRWRFPLVFAAGGMGFLAAGLADEVPGFRPLAAVYAAGVVLGTAGPGAGTGRSGRRGLLVGSAVLASGAIALAATSAFEARFQAMNRYFQRAFLGDGAAGAGFSGTARLDGISELRGEGGDAVALRAFGEAPPLYLRGRVFHRYAGGRWELVADLDSDGTLHRVAGLEVLPGRPDPDPEAAPDWWIAPGSQYSAHYFLPLSASAVTVESGEALLRPGGILASVGRSSDEGYQVHASPAPVEGFDERDLELPDLPELVRALDEILAGLGLVAPADPVAAVLRIGAWFDRRYEYRVGISFDPDRDPIEQFLTDRGHGHCEMFASAGTLLLRRAGVPARYVTGFVCAERNPHLERLWIARQRHAHAWVEYHHPRTGWATAELTPPDGRPDASSEEGWRSWWESVRARWELWSAEGGLARFAGAAGRIVLWLAGPALAIVLGVAARRRSRNARRARRRSLPEPVRQLREEFLRAEARLRRTGFGRRGSETLTEYAARLDAGAAPGCAAVADLARRLAAVRYARFEGATPER